MDEKKVLQNKYYKICYFQNVFIMYVSMQCNNMRKFHLCDIFRFIITKLFKEL